jgi:hypothetical protein
VCLDPLHFAGVEDDIDSGAEPVEVITGMKIGRGHRGELFFAVACNLAERPVPEHVPFLPVDEDEDLGDAVDGIDVEPPVGRSLRSDPAHGVSPVDADYEARSAAGHELLGPDVYRYRATVPGEVLERDGLAREQLCQGILEVPSHVGRHQLGGDHPVQLAAAVAEHLLGRAVGVLDDSVQRLYEEGFDGIVKESLVEALGLVKGVPDPLERPARERPLYGFDQPGLHLLVLEDVARGPVADGP